MNDANQTGPKFFTFESLTTRIPDDAEIVFVSDMFVDDYVGGAELTTQALIDSSPHRIFKIRSQDVKLKHLEQGVDRFWIFGNYARLDKSLFPTIIANLHYSILEYDYKFCKYRSVEKHAVNEGVPCTCHNEAHGELISAFMYGARSLWYMSETQKSTYERLFPFLREKPATVLSSVFDEQTFATIKILREKFANTKRRGWIVLGSPSWIKGSDDAEQWCRDNNLDYEVIWGLSYADTLEKLARAEGFVYLPKGGDTCPRMVIEAKLLGCKLHLNEHVEHAKEEWFATDDILTTESYLYMARERFWKGILSDMREDDPSISGYTTTFNCIENGYPFIESIKSMLGFCDEVVVVDAGSTDGTYERLVELAASDDRLVLYQQIRDRSKKRWAIDFDGRLKALARSLCTKAFCWQQDVDEVVHESDYVKIRKLVEYFPRGCDLLCLPVIEYWGSAGKVRCDIHPWKWRLSRNKPGITHGIPAHLRRYDDEGELYAAPGTDSCDYIWMGDYTPVKYANFYTRDVDALRNKIFEERDEAALRKYEAWYNEVVTHLPSVHHYSWFDVRRKAEMYRTWWSQFWASMYNLPQDDTADNNMWFDKPWSSVTDEELDEVSRRLEEEKGGWIFHKKIDWDAPSYHITCVKSHPALMTEWIKHRRRCN